MNKLVISNDNKTLLARDGDKFKVSSARSITPYITIEAITPFDTIDEALTEFIKIADGGKYETKRTKKRRPRFDPSK